MTERDKLIVKLRRLIEINAAKQERYSQRYNNTECGYLTKEAVIMMSLLPKMRMLGVTFEDCK